MKETPLTHGLLRTLMADFSRGVWTAATEQWISQLIGNGNTTTRAVIKIIETAGAGAGVEETPSLVADTVRTFAPLTAALHDRLLVQDGDITLPFAPVAQPLVASDFGVEPV